MSTAPALVLINGLMLMGGVGILSALGLLGRSARGVLAAAGLALMTGVAAVMLVAVALLTVGVPFTVATLAILSLALGVPGMLIGARRHTADPGGTRNQGAGSVGRAALVDRAALVVFVALLATYGVVGLIRATAVPLAAYDAWSIWTRKALVLFHFDRLPLEFFGAETYASMNADYPILLPLLEAIQFRAMGGADTQALHVELWVLLVAFGWALAFVANRVTRPAIWAPIVLAAVLAPAVYGQLLSAYADVPMGLFLGVGLLLLTLWLAQRGGALAQGGGAHLVLAVLFLATSASIKNEGLMAATVALLAAGVLLALERRWRVLRHLALAAAGFAVALAPWRVWTATHGVEGLLPVGQGLDPSYLVERLDRVIPSVKGLVGVLVAQGGWAYLLPVAVAATLVCLFTGTARRLAAYYLVVIALVGALVVWSFWLSPNPIGDQIASAIHRVATAVAFVSLAALLHLTGELERAGRRVAPARGSRSPGSPPADEPPRPRVEGPASQTG